MLDLTADNIFDFKTAKSEKKYSLLHYRVFSLLGAIAYPVFYYLMKISVPDAQDYLYLRLIISLFCIIGFVSTFSDNILRRNIDRYALFIVLTMAMHSLYLLGINNFNSEYFSDFYITTVVCCFVVKKRSSLIIFLVTTFILFSVLIFSLTLFETAIYDAASVFVLYFAVFMILSNKIMLENEINISGTLMENLFEESPDAVFFVDQKKDKIIGVNNKAIRVFGGNDKSKLTGQSLQKLLNYDYKKNLRTGHEIMVTDLHGKNFWADIAWQKMKVGNKDYSIIRLMDIDGKKKTETELMSRDELLHGVAEASSVLMLKKDYTAAVKTALQTIGKSAGVDRVYIYENVTDPQSRKAFFNHRFEWIKESDSFRVNRMRLQHLAYGEYFPRWQNELNRGKTVKGNVANFSKEERAIFESKGVHSVMIVPIMINENFSGFIGFEYCSDDHIWNHQEESILRTAAAVISGAIFRQSVEHELIEAKHTAEASSKAKESFLANVSHEIRTPMNGILGLTQLLQKSTLDEKQTQYISAIKQSSEHLLVIINDLLDFSKIVAGQVEFEKIEFELAGIIYNINQTYGSRALEKGIQLKVVVDENIPQKLMGDPVRLNQVLVNLIGNAIKFTETGFVSLKINCTENDDKKSRLEFIVEDTGIGIPEDKLDSIFESFKQASSDTTRKYGGTGLGLSIVKKLLDAQDGKIQVKSIPGKGSRFSFDLVFESAENVTVQKTSSQDDYHSLKNVRVLLAEDNVVNQLLANDLIADWGADIDIADNGEIAIDKLKQNNYDLILMDVQMPVVNGLEATEIIRKYCSAPVNSIPIIAMTANAIKGDDQKYIAAGMNDYITKPFNPLDLNKKIWQYLSPEKKSLAQQPTGKETNTTTVEQEFTSTIIDLSNLKEFSRGKTDFIIKMLTLLQQQTPPAIEEIGKSIQTADWQNVRALAHKMKPNISLLGNSSLDAFILKIEKNAESLNRLETMPETYSKFKELLNPAMTEVHRALAFFNSGNKS